MSKDSFDTILSKIEDELARCYGFVISISARDCLTQSAEAKAIAAAGNNRAATLIYQNPGEDELQLGLYFQPKLIETLSAHDPSDQLNHENLDAFCVAVEELSHFHLIANRAYSNQVVSRLELEWQGEIDKWLMSIGWQLSTVTSFYLNCRNVQVKNAPHFYAKPAEVPMTYIGLQNCKKYVPFKKSPAEAELSCLYLSFFGLVIDHTLKIA
ncbi:MAG: hypothetical protein NTX25_07315 [Proteobacteria bacterium]|nr:hypothetical protein [Pseudomonadota bacterium]